MLPSVAENHSVLWSRVQALVLSTRMSLRPAIAHRSRPLTFTLLSLQPGVGAQPTAALLILPPSLGFRDRVLHYSPG